jgi:hypothetical protein
MPAHINWNELSTLWTIKQRNIVFRSIACRLTLMVANCDFEVVNAFVVGSVCNYGFYE